jgi:hypothetical protein
LREMDVEVPADAGPPVFDKALPVIVIQAAARM